MSDDLIDNPIGPNAPNAVTAKQSTTYNILLTQIAKIVDELHNKLLANQQINKQANAVLSWQYILADIKQNLLPEFYVVFQDKTIDAPQRRQLYDMTQAIYYALKRYNTAVFVQKLALCLPLSDEYLSLFSIYRTFKFDIPQNSNATTIEFSETTDNYLTGAGDNASNAYSLTEMAQQIAINGGRYIRTVIPYYDLLIDEPRLLSTFEAVKAQTLAEHLIQWQQQRYSVFGAYTGSAASLQRFMTVDHPLSIWIRQKRNANQDYGLRLFERADAGFRVVSYRPNSQSLISKPEVFTKGLGVSIGSMVMGGVLVSAGGFLTIPFGLIYLIGVLYGSYQVADGLNYDTYAKMIGEYSSILAMLGIVSMIIGGGAFAVAAIPLFLVAFWTSSLANSTAKQKKVLPSLPNNEGDKKVALKKKDDEDFSSIQQTAVDIEAELVEQNETPDYSMPLAIERHAYHLAILLSDKPTKHLEQLIDATNKLYDYLDYLEEAYPYLATRVNELVKDLTQNTLVRLDELAREFVKDGQVEADVRDVFIEQHEARIDDLLRLNLSQVNELNKTILEKKMSGFASVGQDAEQHFRDSVMELKILLRWLIAQQPDEIQASSHEVILENLEATTLNNMQTAFFDSQTSTEQRQELQRQVERLIAHFKGQNIADIYQPNTAEEDAHLQDLLQLSRQHKRSTKQGIGEEVVDTTDNDSVNAQAVTQDFIDLNRHYIDEVVAHWH